LRRFQTHVVLVGKYAVVEGQAYGIGAGRGYEAYILACDVALFEALPELVGGVGSHGLTKHQVDHVGRVGARESEHVALGVEPVAEVGAPDE